VWKKEPKKNEREKGILSIGHSLRKPMLRPTGLRLAPQVLKFFNYVHFVLI
jgi:hypothetical protein